MFAALESLSSNKLHSERQTDAKLSLYCIENYNNAYLEADIDYSVR